MTRENTAHTAHAGTSGSSFGRNASGVLVVPHPAPGQALNLDMISGSSLGLSFYPGDATVSRSGNDLTFSFDHGGSVTVADFFVVENGAELPALILPGGEEVAAAQAFADSDLDLATAAGPAASGAESSGMNAYADDPGDLIDGVDRLGSLLTDYWERDTQEEIRDAGVGVPAAGSGSDPNTPDPTDPTDPEDPTPVDPDPEDPEDPTDPVQPGGDVSFAGSVYEDALPWQHLGDRTTFEPGRIDFDFTPTGTTFVTGIHLSGFHAGTVIYLGDPSDPATVTITVTGPDQVIDFSPDDFSNGVYLKPPLDSDADMTISATVDVVEISSGIKDTLTAEFVVVVDAVADRPELGGDLSVTGDSSGHHWQLSDSSERYDDGYNIVNSAISAGQNGGPVTVAVTVSATFGDYLDGSENHYLLIETHASLGIDLASLPDGYAYLGTIVIDGVEYHQIGVDNAVIEAGSGTVSLPVRFTGTGGDDGKDQALTLRVGAYAEEDVDPSGEITLDNNTAHITTEVGGDNGSTIDVVNSSLTVKAGWAYEGNDGSKHLTGGYNPDYAAMDDGAGVDAASTGHNGAPVSISLDGNATGSAEFITSAELTFDQGRGELLVNGQPVSDGMRVLGANGVTYDFAVDPDTGTVTITVNGRVTSLDELNMTFRPDSVGDHRYDDSDVGLSFKVNVANEAGASATYTGTTEVVIDAVADRPDLGADLSASGDSSGHASGVATTEEAYDQGYNTVTSSAGDGKTEGGARVTVTVSATFADYMDGSESHSLLIQTHPHLDLDTSSLPTGYTYLGAVVIDGVEYHRIDVDNGIIADSGGTVSVPVVFTTTGDAAEKTGQDETFELKVGAMAEEGVNGSGEHDGENNTSHVISDDAVNASVDVVNATLNVSVGWAYEGNNASKHASAAYSPDWSGMDGGTGIDYSSTGSNGAPVSIGLDPDSIQGSGEFITSVELTFDQGRGDLLADGQAVYDGLTVSGANGVTYAFSVNANTGAVTITVSGGQVQSLDELDMTFRPATSGDAAYDDSDVGLSYKVSVSNEAGASATYEGKTEIVIDAVADKPVNVGGAGVDYGQGNSAAEPGQTVELSFKATFPDTSGSETQTLFIRVDGNSGSVSHGYGDYVISEERIIEINALAGSNVLASGGDYLELTIPPLSEFIDGSYTFADTGITVTYNGNGSYTVSGVQVELPDLDTLTDGDKSNGELDPNTGNASITFDTVAWAHETADTAGSSLSADNEHDLGNNDAFTKGSGSVTIATPGGNKDHFTLSGGAGFENDMPHNNLPENQADPTAPSNNTDTDGGVGLAITWSFPDSYEYVTEIIISIPLDRYGNPVGEIVYKGTTYIADASGNVTIPVSSSDAKTGFAEGDLVFMPNGHDSGEVTLEVSATITDSRSGLSETKDIGAIDVALDAVANRSGEVNAQADYGDGFSAVGTGDPVTVTVTTTFSDNDGSERHYVLVQQQPHWQGDYAVEYYDLDGDGVSEAYFKVPAPSAPPVDAEQDYAGDAQHLSMADWNTLLATGAVTTAAGVTISISMGSDGQWDPSGEWTVTVTATLTPPDLSEGSYSLGTGSLAEEHNINHGTENWEEEYKDNNVAMRPGETVTVEVNNTEGITVETGFLYEAGEQSANGPIEDGTVRVTPSSGDDSFYGNLSVSIPSGHGALYYNNTLLEAGQTYSATVQGKDGGAVTGSLTVKEEGGELIVVFTPDDANASYKSLDLELRLDSNDHSDTDIVVTVNGNLINDKSGQMTSNVGSSGKIVVDAVAGDPDNTNTDIQNNDDVMPGGAEGVTVTVTASFKDLTDGSENHFLLLEAKPGHEYTFTLNGIETTIDVTSGWPTVLGPDGTLYYKIPVTPEPDGTASLEVTVKVTLPYFGGEQSEIKYGAMAEDAPTDDGEITYDNNIAIDVDHSMTINVDLNHGGDDPVSVDVAYENNTPNAHVGDDSEQYAKVNLPDDADTILLNPGAGTILIKDGDTYTPLTPDANGWVTVPGDQAGNIYYKVPENYSDTDLTLEYEISGGAHDGKQGKETVHVDAVAQQASVDAVSVDTGNYTHTGDGAVTITVGLSGMDDPDPSTSYYVLIQAKPGWECLENGAELVLIDGEAYFKVPVDPNVIQNGEAEVSVSLKTPQAGNDGTVSEKLNVGVMVVDTPTDQGEYTMDNNVSVNMNGEVAIDKSVAEPDLTLTLTAGHEDNLGDAARLYVSGVGNNDEVTELHFSVDAAEGVFTFDGLPIGAGGYSDAYLDITVSQQGGITTISITPKAPATGFSESDLQNYINGKLSLATADGNTSNADIEINWGYTVRDTLSGDTASADETRTVIIDAVAHKPEVTSYEVEYGDGKEAALPGDTVTVKASVEFTNIDAETNYVLVQLTPGWEVNGITVTVNGQEITYSADEIKALELFYPNGAGTGGAYYKVPLEKDGTVLDPGVGEGGTYTAEVEVTAKAPSSGITGDTQGSLGIGGAAVDSYTDGETDLSNNVASTIANKDGDGNGICIGVVDTTGIAAEQTGSVPDEGEGDYIGFDITPVGGNNDVITGLALTTSDKNAGDFYYDGVKLTYDDNGRVTLPPAGLSQAELENWRFDTAKLEFLPSDTFGGTLNVTVNATVEDSKSGASKDGLTGTLAIEVTPVATQPTDLTISSEFSQTDDGVWVLTLSAIFADVDGSEEHFFVIKLPDGLVLDGTYSGITECLGPNGETGYYSIPVSATDPNPSLDLHFRATSEWDGTGSVTCHAASTENGETAWAADPTSGNEISPADDGSFGYLTEHVDGFADFSSVTEDMLIYGGDGADDITGGQGNDIIYGGAGNDILNGGLGDDTIYAGSGTNIIIGGAGNDTMYGGSGQDTFVWEQAHFGNGQAANDSVLDFEYGKDLLHFTDVFGSDLDFSSVDSILSSGQYSGSLMQLAGDSCTVTANFGASGVSLFIDCGGKLQTVDVSFSAQGSDYQLPSSADEAADILKNLISQGVI